MASRPYTSLAKGLQIKVDNSYVSDILPLQLIYGGNTWQHLHRFKFPEYFLLSVNLKHFSNTAEPIKHINEIGLPYVNKQREKLDNNNQAAFFVLDVFSGQMTQERATLFRENSILCIVIPSNIINFSQPLNFTVNSHCELLIKKLMDGLPKSLTKSSLFIKNWKRWRLNFTSPKRELFIRNDDTIL